MAKTLSICPFCDDSRAFSWQGLLLHVKAKHPGDLAEMKANKAMYLEKFACDEAGNPLAAATPEPEPTPADPPEETEHEKAMKTPAPEVTPPTSKKEKPAEGGGFRGRIANTIFGD